MVEQGLITDLMMTLSLSLQVSPFINQFLLFALHSALPPHVQLVCRSK